MASVALKRSARRIARSFKPIRLTKLERLLDEIKDEIDQLGELRVKQCREGAADLIDYIQLHYAHRGQDGY